MEVYNSSFSAQDLENAIKAVPSIGENGNWWIGDTDTGVFAGGVDVSGAEVGQIIKVAEVDENGRPTAWMSEELQVEEWKLLDDLVFSEETVSIWEYEYEVDEVKEIFIYTNGLLSNETFGGMVYVNGEMIGPSGSLPAIVEEGVSHTRFYAHYVGGGWLSSVLNYRYDSLVTGQQSFKDAMGPVDTNIGVANKIVIRAGYGSEASRFKGGSMKIYVR